MDRIGQRNRGLNISWVLTIYIALKPLYLFSSGTLQIADMFFLVAFFAILGFKKFKIHTGGSSSLGLLTFIVIYQLIVNITWYFVLDNSDLVRRIIYYVFNYLVFVGCLQIVQVEGEDRTITAIANGCIYGSVVSFVGLIVGGLWSSTRRAGFFNNPNQLGYFALLIMTFCLLYPNALSRKKKYIVYSISLISILLSASKAAFVGVFVIALFYILFGYSRSTKRVFYIKLLVLVLAGIALYMVFFSNSTLVLSNRALYVMRARIMYRGLDSDNDMWSGRGYGRIAEMGFHYLFGLGEGAYERFSIMHGVEANTTYATILVSYGIVGSVLYITLFWKTIKKTTRRETLYVIACMSGVLFYFLSHNALRNTLLWIILAIISITDDRSEESLPE